MIPSCPTEKGLYRTAEIQLNGSAHGSQQPCVVQVSLLMVCAVESSFGFYRGTRQHLAGRRRAEHHVHAQHLEAAPRAPRCAIVRLRLRLCRLRTLRHAHACARDVRQGARGGGSQSAFL